MARSIWVRLMAGTVLLLSSVSPGLVLAEDYITTPYVGILGNYANTDDDDRPYADDGQGFQLLSGWPFGGGVALELQLNRQQFDTGAGLHAARTALGLDGLYYFRKGFSPYVLVGAGGVENEFNPGPDRRDWFWNVGAGLLSSSLGKYGLRVRADVRYVEDDVFDNPGDVHVNAGLIVPFGGTRVVERVRQEYREVVIPPEPVLPAPPPPPRDSDGDGVIDEFDRCPNTLRGAEVDRFGCTVERVVITLHDVNFEYDSATLTQTARNTLRNVVQAMEGQPGLRVEIAGHTDSIASHQYNQRLSERRAQSVVNFLVDSGIARDRLRAVGYGESEPIAPNTINGSDNPEGRALNRRVEFRVISR